MTTIATHPRRRPILALALTLALVGSACGGGHGEEEGGGGGDATTTTSAPDGASTPEPGTFGTMEEAVCGPGDASGATDQGVTDDAIKIGVLSDADNDFTPGLLQELEDTSLAFVKWCNAAGGINGRKIEVTVRPTKIIEAAKAVSDACAEDFMLVGGGTALDASITPDRVACGLAEVTAFTNASDAAASDLHASPIVRLRDYEDVGIFRLAAEAFPDAKEHLGVISYASTNADAPFTETIPAAVANFGMQTVYTANFPTPPATVDNYRPYVEDLSSAGTRIFTSVVPPEQIVPFMVNLTDAGVTLDAMISNRSQYSSALIDGNDSLDSIPTWVETIVHPFELAADNPPTQQYLDAMDAHQSGWSDDPKALGVESWSAWLLWAKAATACGSDLTRDCVMEQVDSVVEWDGGGLTAPQTRTTGDSPAGPWCVAALRATTDGFTYDEDFTQPNEGIWNCSDEGQQPKE